MNQRLQVKHTFCCLIHYENRAFINQYHVTLDLVTACRDHESQNIAMDRMVHMLHAVFADSVMIESTDTDQIKLYRDAGLAVTTLPAEPVDQIICLMLHCKMNAVCEDRLIVNSISLCSDQGDHVWYLHNDDETAGPFQEAGWWNDAEPSQAHLHHSGDTVVDLKTKSAWARLDLDWPSDSNTNSDGKVVFAKFDRDQDH